MPATNLASQPSSSIISTFTSTSIPKVWWVFWTNLQVLRMTKSIEINTDLDHAPALSGYENLWKPELHTLQNATYEQIEWEVLTQYVWCITFSFLSPTVTSRMFIFRRDLLLASKWSVWAVLSATARCWISRLPATTPSLSGTRGLTLNKAK